MVDNSRIKDDDDNFSESQVSDEDDDSSDEPSEDSDVKPKKREK